ncbi:hypothetical protein [Bradyrhizobium sp. ISRA463]|uniref:hypothetical protein n=1 Tax=Bradyrhizobium sp. ISRA463 TaxID=2866199 RepID=UPI0024796054|nr:hypothetical protein [Bradyrhizobium sp. ISRA463]WGS17017.1 hypothetical protein MTX22_20070 [Bradyrhizobium sp. ISRA463]
MTNKILSLRQIIMERQWGVGGVAAEPQCGSIRIADFINYFDCEFGAGILAPAVGGISIVPMRFESLMFTLSWGIHREA